MSGGAAKAVVHSLSAAEAALAIHAYEEAADHYERALAALEIVRGHDAAARCDVMLALGAARWQASTPERSSTFARALELARGLGSADRLAQAALGAGGRFYAPSATDLPEIEVLDEALAELPAGDSALRVRLLARQAENLVSAEPAARARELANEAVEMARRIGEPEALATALMGLHAALLHADHAPERRRLAEEALAVAGELGAGRDVRARPPLAALRPCGARRAGRGVASARRARAPCRRPPAALVSACVARVAVRIDRRWPAASIRPSGLRVTPSLWPNGRGHRRRARTSRPSSWRCGASRAVSTSCCPSSSAWRAASQPSGHGIASCRSPISTPATGCARAMRTTQRSRAG